MPKITNTPDKLILDRISRIEGQLNGVRRMITERKECIDIITQISALREAVSMLGAELMKDDLICKQKNKEKISEEYIKKIFKMK